MTSVSKPGGFDGAPSSILTCSCFSASPALALFVGASALECDDHSMAGFDDAGFNRFEARVALAKALERLVDGLVFDGARGFRRLDRRQVAGIERRDDIERGFESERLAFFEDEVLDVRRGDRLDAFFVSASPTALARGARRRPA